MDIVFPKETGTIKFTDSASLTSNLLKQTKRRIIS